MNENLQQELKEIRKSIFITAYKGRINAAHLASSFSIVEILYALYFRKVLNFDADNPNWENRDKLILSKGHASLALYHFLNKIGYISDEAMKTFCFPKSMLGGEPNILEVPGVEATTGSLGHGLPFSVGIAMANKLSKNNAKVYVIVGDGECQEGSIWEAVIAANRYQLDDLTVILDCNKLQKMDLVENTANIVHWDSRWSAFGWEVINVDGHDVDEIEKAFRTPKTEKKPRVILANTIKGKGVSIMENQIEWHYRMPNKRQLKAFMEELNITQEDIN